MNITDLALGDKTRLINVVNQLCQLCYTNSANHGFHDGTFNFGEKIALIHSELSEALECERKGGHPDEHCPSHHNVTVELADACIRIFDLAGRLQLNLGAAMIDKMHYNATRPYKHGKLF